MQYHRVYASHICISVSNLEGEDEPKLQQCWSADSGGTEYWLREAIDGGHRSGKATEYEFYGNENPTNFPELINRHAVFRLPFFFGGR